MYMGVLECKYGFDLLLIFVFFSGFRSLVHLVVFWRLTMLSCFDRLVIGDEPVGGFCATAGLTDLVVGEFKDEFGCIVNLLLVMLVANCPARRE